MSLSSRDPILLTPGPLTTSLATKAAMLFVSDRLLERALGCRCRYGTRKTDVSDVPMRARRGHQRCR